jgi:multicomponent Na+:H+ antiporter subunit C
VNANLALILTSSSLIGCGVYLLLERSLTRVLVGLVLMSNGVNILFLVAGGPAGRAPIVGLNDVDEMSDPLPQAMVLTAIVITLGTTAFLLAMAHRSWQLTGHDDVQDDVEDAVIRRLAAADEASDSFDLSRTHHADDEDPDDVGDLEAAEPLPAKGFQP